MGTTLVINPGSSSRKYALYDADVKVLEWRYEATNSGFEVCIASDTKEQTCSSVTKEQFAEAFSKVVEAVSEYLLKKQAGLRLDAIAVRIVAPGTYFQKHHIITDEFIERLEHTQQFAPLHIPHILREIKAARELFAEIPLCGISDSAFHTTLPARAREYSLATAEQEELDIHRFGYHGLSVASVLRRVATQTVESEKVVVCHIGNGVSVTAVQNEKSVETTMGYSPVTGVVMGSRAGDIDGGALLALMRKKNLDVTEAELYLNSRGGLQGLAGQSDIRHLLDRACKQDEVAMQALDIFVYHIQKAIAAATVAMEGMDTLVFTATAGVRSSDLRERICARLKHLGVVLHPERNTVTVSKDGVISSIRSKVKIMVLRTDEMGEMNKNAALLIAAADR